MAERRQRPHRISEAIDSFLDREGIRGRVEQASVITEWPSLVGEHIARVTEPLSITRGGTLFVAVRTNAWMNELSLMEPELLASLNKTPGRAKIERIYYRLMR